LAYKENTLKIFLGFTVLLCLLLTLLATKESPKERTVLLSFDVEPIDGEKDVLDLINILEQENISATFFVTGEYARQYPDVVRKMKGQEVACHAYTHKRLIFMTYEEQKKEITSCRTIIEALTHKEVTGFRAPYNLVNKDTLKILEEDGFTYDASVISGLRTIFPTPESIAEIYVSSIFGIPLEDVVWLHYVHVPDTYFYILKNKITLFESYLFHPHHIIRQKQGFYDFINYLKAQNTIFINHSAIVKKL